MWFLDRLTDLREDVTSLLRGTVETTRSEEEATVEEESTEGLPRVLSADFRAKFNASNCHCEKFELVNLKEGTPVIRRGANLSFSLKFSAPIDVKKVHNLKVFFTFGNAPNTHKGTLASLLVTGKKMFEKNHHHWDVRVAEQEGELLSLEVQVPTGAPVGVWRSAVEITERAPSASPPPRHLTRLKTLIYILFNPWKKEDGTYMPEEEKRQEYVLNDVGKIWQGSHRWARGRHWVYGQFDDVVLPACVILLERSGLRPQDRGDPVLVSRALSKMVNHNDRDNGVLVGNWSDKYEGGTAPTAWTGSIRILEEYVRTNKPVKYAQCWVYAGVLNTVCRALGLPCRVVSNFNSAHDTDSSLTIDEYFDKDSNPITTAPPGGADPSGVDDSIWNFHVWDEAWMERPDLPSGYGGWQAIDSTPQERSGGQFQCGPASLEAVRRGHTDQPYDVSFVLAEVNADVVKWLEDKDAQDGFRRLSSYTKRVGTKVLTKKAGGVEGEGYTSRDYEDLTEEYKPSEGTRAERVTLYSAARRSRNARHAFRFPSEAIEDVEFSLTELEQIKIGDDFSVEITAKNLADKPRSVTLLLRAGSIYYTGAPAKQITNAEGVFVLEPKEEKTMAMPVQYERYYRQLVEHAFIKMVAMCTVKETSYAWMDDDCFEVVKPDIKVEVVTGEAVVGGELEVSFSFMNPLPETLRECRLVIDGPGLTRPKTIPINNVAPKGKMQYLQKIYPKKSGNHTLVAVFNSVHLLNLSGSTSITVA